MMIRPNNSVPLPSTLDDEVLEGVSASDQPSRVLSQVSLFICSCRLFEVLYDILSIFYTTDISQQRPLLLTSTEVDECITNVLKLNKRIDMLEADVPDELRSPEQVFASSEPKHSTLYLQQQMYHCRCVGSNFSVISICLQLLPQNALHQIALSPTSAIAMQSRRFCQSTV